MAYTYNQEDKNRFLDQFKEQLSMKFPGCSLYEIQSRLNKFCGRPGPRLYNYINKGTIPGTECLTQLFDFLDIEKEVFIIPERVSIKHLAKNIKVGSTITHLKDAIFSLSPRKTLKQISRETGLSYQVLCKILSSREEHSISQTNLEILAGYLDLDLMEILPVEDIKKAQDNRRRSSHRPYSKLKRAPSHLSKPVVIIPDTMATFLQDPTSHELIDIYLKLSSTQREYLIKWAKFVQINP